MILVTSALSNPRLRYISEVLFRIILRTDYKLVAAEEIDFHLSQNAGAIVVSHGLRLTQTHIHIPSDTLLYENNLRELETLNPESAFAIPEGNGFSQDVFAYAFRIITEYDRYSETDFDMHGRYRTRDNISQPWLHVLAEIIWQKAAAINPGLKREAHTFDYRITFDIDSPWLYRHKPLLISGGGMGKDLFKGDLAAFRKRLTVLAGREADPYDTYEYIFTKAPVKKLAFFFLVDRNHPRDERHTFRNGAYRNLIRSIHKKGCRIGIHPSYSSFLDKKRIGEETRQLRNILTDDIASSRMHYLRYRLPETYRYLLDAGIRQEYTTASPGEPGFRHGMAVAFPWFDCIANQQTELWLHPTMAMDRTLQKYQAGVPETAIASLKELIDTTYRFSGTFVFLMHNSTLSEWKEWTGWRTVFEETVRYLLEKCEGSEHF